MVIIDSSRGCRLVTPLESSTGVDITEYSWEIKLKYALRCLKSNQLDKRLSGVKDIDIVINCTYEGMKHAVNSRVLNPMYLLDMILIERLVEEIIGGRMHVQILARSHNIFKFLIQYSDLFIPARMIDLWNCR